MAREIEVKLEAPGATAARRLLDAPWFKRLEAAPLKRNHLVSVYYDTPATALRREGMSLRVRRIGPKRIQTVKAGPRGACGPFCRHEWEREITGNRPDLDGDSVLDRFSRKKLKRELRPLFTTEIKRAAIPVHCGGSEIEVAIDRGEVRTRRNRRPISEIELELKAGDPAPLVQLAKRIAQATRASYGTASKAERGYALRRSDGPAPVGAQDIVIDPQMNAGEALTTIALSCVHHFAGNRDAVLAGLPEGVHQMRVGLRRLRAALSFFKDMLTDAESGRIRRELKWLLVELGPARDLDVLIDESLVPLQQQRADGNTLDALKLELKRRRDACIERARQAVGSDRYRRIVLDTALWATGGGWTNSGKPPIAEQRSRRAADFAAAELARRERKIEKKLKRLAKLDPRRRHKLRIAAKKLRYADEFFASLFDRRRERARLKRHRKALKALQSSLGRLNDMRAHATMAGDFLRPQRRARKKPQKAFAFGFISGDHHAHARGLIAKAAAAGEDLAALRPFWK
ncbi:MAG TPA: CHAD domain-containing protein [Stellaceae bacterium]|nr:CHAD domain-containing protein [Stellaceae bacterium]